MYVLDTNVLYYVLGLSPCEADIDKLKVFIASKDVFVSTTSLYEFIIKNRNNSCAIQNCGKFIADNNIKIASNIMNPIPDGVSLEIEKITDAQLIELCKKILEIKIDIESRFISLVFDVCLFSGYYFSANLSGEEPTAFCGYVLKTIYKMFGEINTEVLNQVFKEGYETDDCENYVRECFYNLLDFELRYGIPYIEKANNISDNTELLDIEDWLDSEDFVAPTENNVKKMRRATSTKYLQKLGVKYKKNNNDPYLQKHIGKISSIINTKIQFSALQEYFYDTLDLIISNGAAMWKNDFLDALIMCNIQDEHVLISFDKGVINRLEKRKNQYPKYQESLELYHTMLKE